MELADKPDWLVAWRDANPEAAAAADAAAQQAAQRRASTAAQQPKPRTPKPPTAPAQGAQPPMRGKLHLPAGSTVWSNPMGHDLEEPEPWAWDRCKRREKVLDHNFSPPRVVRTVGWRACLKCSDPFWSDDIIALRMCAGCKAPNVTPLR